MNLSDSPYSPADALDAYARACAMRVLLALGAPVAAGELWHPQRLAAQIGVLPAWQRLWRSTLDAARIGGYLQAQADMLATTERASALARQDAQQSRQALLERYPMLAPHAEMLERCCAAYADVVGARQDGVNVLFPSGSPELVRALYHGNPAVDACNEAVARTVAALVAAKREQAPGTVVRVIEVGAGTGATTDVVLEHLGAQRDDLEYHITDLSPSLVAAAQRRYGARYPYVRCRVLDIEADSAAERADAHLIVASNVVHATRRIQATLGRIKRMLADDGLIVLNEVVAASDFATLVFGLTPGWWLYEDEDVRLRGGPLLDLAHWRSEFAQCGFDPVEAIGDSAGDARQQVLIAASDGRACVAGAFSPAVEPAPALPPQPVAQAAPAAAQTVARLSTVIADALRMQAEQIDADAPFVELGIDSIMAMDAIERINRSFALQLRPADLFGHPSVRRLAAHLDAQNPTATTAVAPQTADTAPAPEPEPAWAAPQPAQAVVAAPLRYDSELPEPIAIIGMAGRFPGADDVESFWRNLVHGHDAIAEMPAQRRQGMTQVAGEVNLRGGFMRDVDAFDAAFFQVPERAAEMMDPQQRLLLEQSWAAFEDAAYPLQRLNGSRCGVFVGCFPGDYKSRLSAGAAAPHPYLLTGTSEAMLAGRVAFFFDLKGPAISIDTACSSSLVALHTAAESLRSGGCDLALVAGVTVLSTPQFHVLAHAARMTSPDGQCRTFDAGANGFVPGEAVGVVVLKRLSAALADNDRIRAVVLASGLNQDGASNGITAPNASAQTDLISDVYRRHRIDPAMLGYVEAHGTGTALGDPIEFGALSDAFARLSSGRPAARSQYCALGSVKTNIGHCLPAAGIAGLIKTALCVERGLLVPSLNFDAPNPHLSLQDSPFYLNSETRAWPDAGPRTAAISAFGFSGTNAHVVIQQPPTRAPAPPGDPALPWLLPLSAKDRPALLRRVRELEREIGGHRHDLALRDVACTLSLGRSHFGQRLAFVACDLGDLRAALKQCLQQGLEGERMFAGPRAEHSPRAERAHAQAQQYLAGETPQWQEQFAGAHAVSLPPYPFARDRFWAAGAQAPAQPAAAQDNDPAMAELLAPLAGLAARGGVLQAHRAAFDALEAFGAARTREALQTLDALPRPDESAVPVRVLMQRAGVVAGQARLFTALLAILARHGELSRNEHGYSAAATAPESSDEQAAADAAALAARYPIVAPHLELLRACVRSYADLLSGRIGGPQVLFPGGSTTLVEGIYRGNEITDHYNEIVAQVCRGWCRDRSPRMIEIGAGTGATSAAVLAALPDPPARYDYTDLSAHFLRHGERRFGANRPWLHFRALDIERAPAQQGFDEAGYDLALATNVLHATRDIAATLAHVRNLLRPGGLLVINEIMQRQDIATMTFGLTEGWWRYGDAERRIEDSPLLEHARWRELLAEAGFSAIAEAVPGEGTPASRVLVARARTAAAAAVEAAEPIADPRSRQRVAAVARVDRPKPDAVAQARGDVWRSLCEVLVRVLKIAASRLDPSTRLAELGIDSLVSLELTDALAQTIAPLREHALLDCATLGDLERMLRAAQAPAAAPRAADAVAAAARAEPIRPAWSSQRVEHGATHVESFSAGDGEPVLLLGPLNLHARAWHHQFAALQSRYRVIALHPPGRDATRPVAANADFRIDAEILLDAIDALLPKGERFHCVGWSLGGCYGQLIAAHHPQRLRSLVLVNCAARFDADAEPVATALREELSEDPDDPGAALRLSALSCGLDAQSLRAFQRSLADFDARPLHPAIATPTLQIIGARDRVLAPERQDLRGIASLRVRRMELAGHLAPLTHAEEFNRVLAEFLEHHSAQTASAVLRRQGSPL